MKKINLTNPADKSKSLHKNLSFAASEAYKLLRTNLNFALSEEEHTSCKIVGVTSSIRSEGKSVTSVNLSYSLAEAGKRVLLVDADMRLPSIGKKMEMYVQYGLSNMLIADAGNHPEEIKLEKSCVLDNWYVVTAGDLPPNPSELLGSNRMKRLLKKLSEQFDYIIVDLPPVNIVSDALAVAPCLSGMLVVVRENYSERKGVSECIRQLEMSGVKLLGFVLNDSHENTKNYKYSQKKQNSKYIKH